MRSWSWSLVSVERGVDMLVELAVVFCVLCVENGE